MVKAEMRIDLLTGAAGRRLYGEAEANAIGVGVLAANPEVDVVVVAAHDLQGVAQEWSVRRVDSPHTTPPAPVPTTRSTGGWGGMRDAARSNVVHAAGDATGLPVDDDQDDA